MDQKEFNRLYMESKAIQQMHAELIATLQTTVTIVVQALCRQLDPQLLNAHIEQTIAATIQVQGALPPLSVKILREVLATTAAEALHRNQGKAKH